MSHGMVEDAVQVFRPYQGRSLNHTWSYSVMVITLDFESSDPGSNPGRTLFFVFTYRYCREESKLVVFKSVGGGSRFED